MDDEEEDGLFGFGGGFDDDEDAAEAEAKQKKADDERGFTEAELASCMKVLAALEKDLPAFRSPTYKALRKTMVPLIADLRGRLFDGKSADEYQKKLYNKREANSRLNRQRAHDRNYINSTQLRSERVAHLKMLCQKNDSEHLPQVPDGRVSYELKDDEKKVIEGAGADDADPANGAEVTASIRAEEGPTLMFARSCYICKCRFSDLHAFYDQLCPQCAKLNYTKRLATADMDGRVALVTGARVKIGFEITLKLLRCGATVVATTRFPVNAAERYARQPDFGEWRHRLQIVGLDLRDIARLEAFCHFFKSKYQRLDVIVNNACQTIRRPAAYYSHLIAAEVDWAKHSRIAAAPTAAADTAAADAGADAGADVGADVDADAVAGGSVVAQAVQYEQAAALLQHNHVFVAANGGSSSASGGAGDAAGGGAGGGAVRGALEDGSGGGSGVESGSGGGSGGVAEGAASALLSQVSLIPEDALTPAQKQKLFPVDKLDINAQQLDLRKENSWLLKLGEVSTPEVVEVMAINTISPFVINSRLRPLMMKIPELDKYVVNVSAMEGKFYRYKTACHPHTNMAKAALNMMTCTAAEELSKHNVFMNSVDTGWINDENPLERAHKIAQAHNFQTPLDEVDAAARVLDPVVTGMNGGPRPFGLFFKDYQETEW